MFEEQNLVVKAIEAALRELQGGGERGRLGGDRKAQNCWLEPWGGGGWGRLLPPETQTSQPLASCQPPPKAGQGSRVPGRCAVG